MAYSQNRYKRTVRCSYCNQPGHNRSSCPQLAERIEKIRQTEGDDSYHVRMYDAKKAKRTAKSKDRKCSYCSAQGHNRTTCPELKAHMAETIEQNKVFRAVVLQRLQALGIGIGALCTSDRHRAKIDPTAELSGSADVDKAAFYRVPMIIRHINWEALNFWCTETAYFDSAEATRLPPFLISRMHKLGDNRWLEECGYPFDKEILTLLMGEGTFRQWEDGTHWRSDSKGYYFMEITSPVITPEPPKGWLECNDKSVKALYKKRESYMGSLKSNFCAA